MEVLVDLQSFHCKIEKGIHHYLLHKGNSRPVSGTVVIRK